MLILPEVPRGTSLFCNVRQISSFLTWPFQIEDIHLAREEDTGKSRGFAFVKYEDARSCVLVVDNLIGFQVSCVVAAVM